MRIRLLHDYRGKKTKENLIPTGDYEDDNPLLCGLAWYLIDNGHAEQIEGLPPELIEELPIPNPLSTAEFTIPEYATFINREGDIITYQDKLNGIMTLNAKTGETKSTGKHPKRRRE